MRKRRKGKEERKLTAVLRCTAAKRGASAASVRSYVRRRRCARRCAAVRCSVRRGAGGRRRRRKSECGGGNCCPLPPIYERPEEIVGARFSAHDPRNGRGITAPRSHPRFPRLCNGRTICHTMGHREPTALCGAPDRARPEATRSGAVKGALECLRGHSGRGDRRGTGGTHASGMSIRAHKPRHRAEMLCHVEETKTRRNQGVLP